MGVVDSVKEVVELVRKIDNVELYRKILDLQSEINELTRENMTLEQDVEKLKKALAFQDKLTFKAPFWFAEGDPVPFCPRCWEADKEAIHVVVARDGIACKCPECERGFALRPSSQVPWTPQGY